MLPHELIMERLFVKYDSDMGVSVIRTRMLCWYVYVWTSLNVTDNYVNEVLCCTESRCSMHVCITCK